MSKLNKKEIGDRIKKIRLSMNETMEEFGKRFNTQKSTINKWEKGYSIPGIKNLKIFEEDLHITKDQLLNGEDEKVTLIEDNLKLLLELEKILIDQLTYFRSIGLNKESVKDKIITYQDFSENLESILALLKKGDSQKAITEINSLINGLDTISSDLSEDLISHAERENDLTTQLIDVQNQINEYKKNKS